jgi:hypothetical protein
MGIPIVSAVALYKARIDDLTEIWLSGRVTESEMIELSHFYYTEYREAGGLL